MSANSFTYFVLPCLLTSIKYYILILKMHIETLSRELIPVVRELPMTITVVMKAACDKRDCFEKKAANDMRVLADFSCIQ